MGAQVENSGKNLQVCFHTTVQKAFPHGFQPAVAMDRKKFVNSWSALGFGKFPGDVNYEGPFLDIAKKVCFSADRKYYAFTSEARFAIQSLLSEAKQKGYNTIYYTTFYHTYQNILEEAGVVNDRYLSAALYKYFPDVDCSREYFRLDGKISPETELLELFREKCAMRIDEVQEARPLLPEFFLLQTLKNSRRFISYGGYLFIAPAYIKIDNYEVAKAVSEIAERLEKKDYAPSSDWKLPNTIAENPEVPLEALIRILCARHFPGYKLTDTGLLCRPGFKLKTSDIIRNFCLENDKFSLSDIVYHVYKFMPRIAMNQVIAIAQATAVQVGEKEFVNLDYLDLDIDAIDNALMRIAGDFPISIQHVPDLFSLPAIEGYPWNLHLLASYCLNKSKCFFLARLSANNSLFGIIAPERFRNLDYYVLSAVIAVQHGVEPEEGAIKKFIFNHGLVAKKREGYISEIKKNMLYFMQEKADQEALAEKKPGKAHSPGM